MTHKIKISIPEPCHENWLEMSPTEKGKFCSACQKNVIDFTKSSDSEILVTYNENENLCGRFRISQLNQNMIIPKEKKSIWMIVAASIIAFLGLGNQTAQAQGKIRVEQTDKKQQSNSINIKSTKNKYSGILLDKYDNPLPGAAVMVKGSKTGIYTDIDGKFTVDAEKGDKLKISAIGYENQEFTLRRKLNITIKMKHEIVEL